MTDVLRLQLVSHGVTDAMAAGRFPADEPLNALGRRQCASSAEQAQRSLTPRRVGDRCVCSPEIRTRQTAELLGLDADVEAELPDLDYGRWRGVTPAELPPVELESFMGDPDSAPHAGESVVALIHRVRAWLDAVSQSPGRVIAITHPAVIRVAVLVALDAPPKSFWRIDVEPVSRTVLYFRDGRWTLKSGCHR